MSDNPLRIVVTGRSGRMGTQVIDQVEEASDLVLAAAVDQGEGFNGVPKADVVIDFTAPEALADCVSWCQQQGVALVTGTTGLQESHELALAEAAQVIPVLAAPNMSVGVNLLCDLVERATLALGDDADVEVLDLHHRLKKDAPSGTANRLLDVIASAKNTSLNEVLCDSRSGWIGARKEGEIGVQTLRGGDVVGEHTVYFLWQGERIELTHRATDRAIFARGAVRAARWLADKPAGRYSMADVLA